MDNKLRTLTVGPNAKQIKKRALTKKAVELRQAIGRENDVVTLAYLRADLRRVEEEINENR